MFSYTQTSDMKSCTLASVFRDRDTVSDVNMVVANVSLWGSL